MTELEALKARHSVRKYTDTKIESDKVEQIKNKIDELNSEGNLKLQFLEDAAKTYNKLFNRAMGLGSAPSVIICVGPDDDTVDERVGYYGQQLVLFAQQLGLNTCWTGTFNRKSVELEAGDKLVIAIAIGYGVTPGKERKTKTADEIVIDNVDLPDWFADAVEAALLAPTAVNQQQFEIIYNGEDDIQFKDLGGILSKVDIGIVRYNFEVGAKFAKGEA